MTIRDDILRVLRENPDGLSDGEIAARLGKLHQQVNQRCRQLALDGRIRRDKGYGVIRNVLTSSGSAAPAPVAQRPSTIRDDPCWEGNVQDAIVDHLRAEGWSIVSIADTLSQKRGIDIVAERDGRNLLVEVEGYPGTTYARGPKTGQPKLTSPTLQAKHWLSDAVLKTMRTRGEYPDDRVGIGLPDMPRYRSLLTEISGSLAALDVLVLLVHDNRTVATWSPAHAPA